MCLHADFERPESSVRSVIDGFLRKTVWEEKKVLQVHLRTSDRDATVNTPPESSSTSHGTTVCTQFESIWYFPRQLLMVRFHIQFGHSINCHEPCTIAQLRARNLFKALLVFIASSVDRKAFMEQNNALQLIIVCEQFRNEWLRFDEQLRASPSPARPRRSNWAVGSYQTQWKLEQQFIGTSASQFLVANFTPHKVSAACTRINKSEAPRNKLKLKRATCNARTHPEVHEKSKQNRDDLRFFLSLLCNSFHYTRAVRANLCLSVMKTRS